MEKVYIFDSTLRDGAQARNITYSVSDKLNMVKLLDKLGIDYIEAGNPESNPKERDFFDHVSKIKLNHSKLVAFGSTRRKNVAACDDRGLKALLGTNTEAISIFGKSWDMHVTQIIKASLEENIEMIEDTISYLKSKNREVIYDAEHFFDGYKANKEYALQTLAAAKRGGADSIVLCDTNGGTLLDELLEAINASREVIGDTCLGIHSHNDAELAVANTLIAVQAGARQVQGTLLGYGERCGNARLSSIIPTLEIKMGYKCLPNGNLKLLTEYSRLASEITNMDMDDKLPYVGRNAFAHKGGMHIDGLRKAKGSFEHTSPELVGNEREYLLSEVAGKAAMKVKLQEDFPEIVFKDEDIITLIVKLKELENQGYSFEGADSSFKLLVMKELGLYKPKFELLHYKISDEPQNGQGFKSYALVKVKVNGKDRMCAAEGNGPVNALDLALREALGDFYPQLMDVVLTDYKVRVINSHEATAAKVRVIIDSSADDMKWSTLGVSSDVIEASLLALIDSIDYRLLTK